MTGRPPRLSLPLAVFHPQVTAICDGFPPTTRTLFLIMRCGTGVRSNARLVATSRTKLSSTRLQANGAARHFLQPMVLAKSNASFFLDFTR